MDNQVSEPIVGDGDSEPVGGSNTEKIAAFVPIVEDVSAPIAEVNAEDF